MPWELEHHIVCNVNTNHLRSRVCLNIRFGFRKIAEYRLALVYTKQVYSFVTSKIVLLLFNSTSDFTILKVLKQINK